MWGDSISTAEAVQYCGGVASVLWRIASVLRRDSCSTCGDSVSTVEAIQYCRGIAAVLWGIASVHVGDSISTVEG